MFIVVGKLRLTSIVYPLHFFLFQNTNDTTGCVNRVNEQRNKKITELFGNQSTAVFNMCSVKAHYI